MIYHSAGGALNLSIKLMLSIFLLFYSVIGFGQASFKLDFTDGSTAFIQKKANERVFIFCTDQSSVCEEIGSLKIEKVELYGGLQDEKSSPNTTGISFTTSIIGGFVGSCFMSTAATTALIPGGLVGLSIGLVIAAILEYIDDDVLTGDQIILLEKYLAQDYVIDNSNGFLELDMSGDTYKKNIIEALNLYIILLK